MEIHDFFKVKSSLLYVENLRVGINIKASLNSFERVNKSVKESFKQF